MKPFTNFKSRMVRLPINNVDTGLDSKGDNVLYKYIDSTHIQGVDGAR